MKYNFIVFAVLIAAAVALPKFQKPESRVVGGSDAAPGQFKYIVSLQWGILTLITHVCGASIVAPNVLVTAAHCETELPNIGTKRAHAGLLMLNDTSNQQVLDIDYFVHHPGYNGGVDSDDISLFFLIGSYIFNDWVQPIALPGVNQTVTGRAVIAGWGSISTTATPISPNHLQFVDVPIIPIVECQAIIGATTPLYWTNICTGPLSGGSSACSGDSGGPVVQPDGSGGDVLSGLVSWGFIPCGSPNAPSVMVSVTYYREWIDQNKEAAAFITNH